VGTGVASAIAIVVGSVAVVCALSRMVCHYVDLYANRTGPGPGRIALLLLTGLGLTCLHAWSSPDTDMHVASLVLGLLMCGVGLLFMVSFMNVGLGPPFELDDDGFPYGIGMLLLGAGNVLSQLSFVWHQPSLSYWGLGAAILGLLVALLAVVRDFREHKISFR
jgi:hypothetical protein